MPDEEHPEYGCKLTEIADRMADYGVPMVYHHHMGTVIETEREVDLLMANTGPNVNLLIDTGHLTVGGNVEATTRRHGHRLKHALQRYPGRCLRKSSGGRHEFLDVALKESSLYLEMARSTFTTSKVLDINYSG